MYEKKNTLHATRIVNYILNWFYAVIIIDLIQVSECSLGTRTFEHVLLNPKGTEYIRTIFVDVIVFRFLFFCNVYISIYLMNHGKNMNNSYSSFCISSISLTTTQKHLYICVANGSNKRRNAEEKTTPPFLWPIKHR